MQNDLSYISDNENTSTHKVARLFQVNAKSLNSARSRINNKRRSNMSQVRFAMKTTEQTMFYKVMTLENQRKGRKLNINEIKSIAKESAKSQ